MTVPDAPIVPAELLNGWELVSDTVETRFRLAAMTVKGRTLLYEDTDLRERLAASIGVDEQVRSFFATRLHFSPSLAPGAGPMIRTTVTREAKRAFADELETRGIDDVESTTRQRIRVSTGDRATLVGYRGRYDRSGHSFPIEGWLAVWLGDGYRISGGSYPRSLPETGLNADPERWRAELLDLIRAVE